MRRLKRQGKRSRLMELHSRKMILLLLTLTQARRWKWQSRSLSLVVQRQSGLFS
jgi:hypothetical protein